MHPHCTLDSRPKSIPITVYPSAPCWRLKRLTEPLRLDRPPVGDFVGGNTNPCIFTSREAVIEAWGEYQLAAWELADEDGLARPDHFVIVDEWGCLDWCLLHAVRDAVGC